MCTDDRAVSMSERMRGKNCTPSTCGATVAAVDHANSSEASRGPTRVAAANVATAAAAPDAGIASRDGGQLGRVRTLRTRRYSAAANRANAAIVTKRECRPRRHTFADRLRWLIDRQSIPAHRAK